MSGMDDTQPEMVEALKKMTKYNKNVVSLMDMMKKALEKLELFTKNKAFEHNDADKEKMDKIFEKADGKTARKLGREATAVSENVERR